MAKLTRKLQKIFAQSASSDQLTVFGTEKTGSPIDSTDVETLQGGSYSYGWDGAIKNDKAPYLSEMNGVQYGITYQLAYMLQHGIPEYISTETYYKGNFAKVVTDSDVKIYYSLIDNNINNDPTTDKESWKEFSGGGSGLEVGDIGTSVYVDESKNLRRYLNGGLILQSQFVEFTTRIKQIIATQPTLACTEQEWQAEALLNVDGCVYKFVIDDNAGTIRLPKYPEYVEITADKLAVVGNGVTLGLTDGTTNMGIRFASQYGAVRTSASSYGKPTGSIDGGTSGQDERSIGVTTDPTKSGIETTGGVTKLKLRYFIQVATGQETQADIVNTLQLANPYSLFDYKYTEAPLYNACWTLANGSWVNGTVQVTAYEGLAVEQNAEVAQGTTVELPSGTSYTKRGLSVKLTGDSSITAYDFELDTANTRFKLPTKVKLASGKAVVGNGVALGLTNGSADAGVFYDTDRRNIGAKGSAGNPVGSIAPEVSTFTTGSQYLGVSTDPTKSGIETDTTDLYLYFYTGEIEQNANLVNVGRLEEQLANKEDIDTWVYFQEGTSGFRYNKRNGYCEQWGLTGSNQKEITVTLLKEYSVNNYNIVLGQVYDAVTDGSTICPAISYQYIDSFVISQTVTGTRKRVYWRTFGTLAEGEY